MSRRNFLRGRILGGLAEAAADKLAAAAETLAEIRSCPAAQESSRYAKSFPILRPPGAIQEDAFLAGCTRCDACIRACPHDAIIHAPPRFRRAAGTPMIDPMHAPCRMCPDTPCISACRPREDGTGGSGVLRSDVPLTMGEARIDLTTCLAYNGSFCTVCAEQCPVEGAIELRGGRPRIVHDRCTGCGVCQNVCPAPANAILLMPLPERPLPGADPEADPPPPAPGAPPEQQK
jgi:ferredoxin-type protein NapG